VFTYRENRVTFLEQGRLRFPCQVTVSMELSPNQALGDEVPGGVAALGSTARMMWDANTGRSQVLSMPPLAPASTALECGGIDFRLDARTVTASFRADSRQELLGVMQVMHDVLPLSLSLAFPDPFTVATTAADAGSARIVWQVANTGSSFETMTAGSRDERCAAAIERLPVLCEPTNLRLLAALAYFERAIRLIVAGHGPTEFAGEAIINLSKVLEVLFPRDKSRDAAKAGLRQLGYEEPLIANTFIRVMLLRAKLDAAHVRLASLTWDERARLQAFLESVSGAFRKMLSDVLSAVADGRMKLAQYASARKARDDISELLDGIALPSAS
jgi:hypothetical protein